MKKRYKILILASIIICCLYIIISIWISISVNNILNSVVNSLGKDYTKYSDVISHEIYNQMNYIGNYSEESLLIVEEEHTYPVTIHWFIGGRVTYKYTCIIQDSNGATHGSSDVLVELKVKLKGFKWEIVDYYEGP